QVLKVFLQRLGFEVLLAENGAEGVDRFAATQPDIVLMDVMMPVMDGYEATRRIKANSGDRWVPVVFLSALDKEENLVAGLEAGGDDYLPKPINFTILDAKLRSVSRAVRFQRRMEENRRRMQVIGDSLMDALIVIDERGIIQTCNTATEPMFGYGVEELVGCNVAVLTDEPDGSRHDEYIKRYLATGEARIIGARGRQLSGRRKDGTVFPIDLSVSEVHLAEGRNFVGIIRDITQRKAAEERERSYREQLQNYYDRQEQENALAHTILRRQIERPELDDPAVHQWMLPAANFSGDVVAAARAADGRLYAMLADATGHGLAAAISALPTLAVFYAMAPRGLPLVEIARELDRKVAESVPKGRFVAATLLCVDAVARKAQVWVAGMTDVLVLGPDGQVVTRIPSRHLPLGIAETEVDPPDVVDLEGELQFVLYSDGLVEATDAGGDPFGSGRLENTLSKAVRGERLAAVRGALACHMADSVPHDDVSLLLVDCLA
ncbi:MAG: SpoIIE family protein phosphatase, partial [Rhodocyclaceae bacterium]|nr:SpoIIE family protein phosphatase [Rhodocyclaceae bacterium]